MSRCKPCFNQAGRAARYKDPDKARERQRKYKAKNREQINAKQREYRARNPERTASYGRQYRERHPERVTASYRRHYEENREYHRQRGIKWRQDNPEKKKAQYDREKWSVYNHTRRAREAMVESEKYTRREIFERDGGRCRLCDTALTIQTCEIDHIVPIKLGGPNIRANVQTLCRPCNRSKHTRLEGQIYLPV